MPWNPPKLTSSIIDSRLMSGLPPLHEKHGALQCYRAYEAKPALHWAPMPARLEFEPDAGREP